MLQQQEGGLYRSYGDDHRAQQVHLYTNSLAMHCRLIGVIASSNSLTAQSINVLQAFNSALLDWHPLQALRTGKGRSGPASAASFCSSSLRAQEGSSSTSSSVYPQACASTMDTTLEPTHAAYSSDLHLCGDPVSRSANPVLGASAKTRCRRSNGQACSISASYTSQA